MFRQLTHNVSPPHERPEVEKAKVVVVVVVVVVEEEEEEEVEEMAFQIELARQFLILAQLHRSHHI